MAPFQVAGNRIENLHFRHTDYDEKIQDHQRNG
jgi:hypothetical protein